MLLKEPTWMTPFKKNYCLRCWCTNLSTPTNVVNDTVLGLERHYDLNAAKIEHILRLDL